MDVKYINGKDLGEPNWRISIRIEGKSIVIKTENFKYGFRDGEDWDKITKFRHYTDDQYEENVSAMTKYPEKMEEFRPLLIEELHRIIKHNILSQKQVLIKEERILKKYENHLNSDIFKGIYREEKLNILVD